MVGVTTATAPQTEPPPSRRRRPATGTIFVLACAAFCVGLVLFLIFVSPILLERTLAQAPPPAPHVVASGTVGGAPWSAEAHDASADLRGVDERGFERIVEPEPCLRLTIDGEEAAEVCTTRLGGPLRAVALHETSDGTTFLLGITAPVIREVRLDGSGTVAPGYVDFGFPLGFVAAPVDGPVAGVTAVDADGEARSRAACPAPEEPGLAECTIPR
jgi:hypothetical protein